MSAILPPQNPQRGVLTCSVFQACNGFSQPRQGDLGHPPPPGVDHVYVLLAVLLCPNGPVYASRQDDKQKNCAFVRASSYRLSPWLQLSSFDELSVENLKSRWPT